MGKGKDTVLVSEEIEHVECYLGIQRLRLYSQFQVHIEVEESIKHFRVPKIILQPIVENSILHGFAENSNEGKITIECLKEGERIVFIITDNGCGMEHETKDVVETFDN